MSIFPAFQARDPRAMIDFLVAVGFEETAVYGEGERVEHAQLDWPEGGGVMFGSHKPDGDFTVEPGTMSCYVVTADPHGVHERARAAGATIERPPRETDYGAVEVGFRDPEGNQWSFGTYAGEPRRSPQQP